MVVCAGPIVLGVDVVERRICWFRNLADGISGELNLPNLAHGTSVGAGIFQPDGEPIAVGMVDAPDLQGVFVETKSGLVGARYRHGRSPLATVRLADVRRHFP